MWTQLLVQISRESLNNLLQFRTSHYQARKAFFLLITLRCYSSRSNRLLYFDVLCLDRPECLLLYYDKSFKFRLCLKNFAINLPPIKYPTNRTVHIMLKTTEKSLGILLSSPPSRLKLDFFYKIFNYSKTDIKTYIK